MSTQTYQKAHAEALEKDETERQRLSDETSRYIEWLTRNDDEANRERVRQNWERFERELIEVDRRHERERRNASYAINALILVLFSILSGFALVWMSAP